MLRNQTTFQRKHVLALRSTGERISVRTRLFRICRELIFAVWCWPTITVHHRKSELLVFSRHWNSFIRLKTFPDKEAADLSSLTSENLINRSCALPSGDTWWRTHGTWDFPDKSTALSAIIDTKEVYFISSFILFTIKIEMESTRSFWISWEVPVKTDEVSMWSRSFSSYWSLRW
jgi:hypothetical protein